MGEGEDTQPARQEFRRMVVWSALAHAGALGLVLVSPRDGDSELPRVIAVELIAPSPAAAPARSAPKPAPAALPEPAKPPPPKPKQIVLPERPQAPKPAAKPKPREPDTFREPEKKPEKSLEELLAEMRGEPAEASPAPAAPTDSALAPSPGSRSGTGEPLSAEERAWQARVRRHMKGIWVVPPGFRTQSLQTRVVVTLDAVGNILGEPRISQRSGNPWYDDGVVRGLTKASPLPAPPKAGDWVMWFEPADSL